MQSLWFRTALLPDGWADSVRLLHHDGKILSVETNVRPTTGNVSGDIALPGLPNLHSHAFQRGMSGLAETRGPGSDSFWTWRDVMYRFLDRLTPEDVEAIASLAYAEMLETGFTRVGEFHYLHHAADGSAYEDVGELAGRISAAADTTGIGLTMLPVFYAHGGFGGAEPAAAQRRFLNSLDGFARLVDACRAHVRRAPGANCGVAPHSLRAATPDQLRAILAIARDGPIHIHIAEQTKEVEDCLAWSGQRPVEWLLDHFPVDRSWCLVHATHMSASETERLARSGAVAGLTPITEANLGDGLFPAPAYASAGGAFGIGSDSNVLIDAAEELRLLEYGQRIASRSRNLLAGRGHQSTGAALFKATFEGGSRALGQPAQGLAVGAPADIVALRGDHPSLIAREKDALLDAWIFGSKGAVDQVWRGGRRVVAGGRHTSRARIERDYAHALKRLLR